MFDKFLSYSSKVFKSQVVSYFKKGDFRTFLTIEFAKGVLNSIVLLYVQRKHVQY